jgi:hypothetical protein
MLRVSRDVSRVRRGPTRLSRIFTRPDGALDTLDLGFFIFVSDAIEGLYTIEALVRLAELFT